MSQLYLKDIKFIIITSEIRDAVLANSLKKVRNILAKHCGEESSIKVIEVDEYLDLESNIENIDRVSKLMAGATIAVTVLDSPLYMKKFHTSILHNVMKYIYKISIVSSTWADDILVKNGIGKAEMRFNSMLTYALPFKSCVVNEHNLAGTTAAQREMLIILLNVFDISTHDRVSSPLIDNEVILVNDVNHDNGSDVPLKTVTVNELFDTLLLFVNKRDVHRIFEGKKVLVSDEIRKFSLFYEFVKHMISLLGGEVTRYNERTERDSSLVSLEHDIDLRLNFLDTKNRFSLFYLFDRWGINCMELNSLDEKYKFFYHFPYIDLAVDSPEKENRTVGMTNFFGYHKLFTCYFLQKLHFEPSKYLSKKYYGLIAYTQNGNKYTFARSKGMLVASANDLETWYSNGEVCITDNTVYSEPFLTKKITDEEYNTRIKKYISMNPALANQVSFEEENIEDVSPKQDRSLMSTNFATVVESPLKEQSNGVVGADHEKNDKEASFKSNDVNLLAQTFVSESINTEHLPKALTNEINDSENKKEHLGVNSSDKENIKSAPEPTKKRKLGTEQTELSKKRTLGTEQTDVSKKRKADYNTSSTSLKHSSFAIDQLGNLMDERISLAGGNNEFLAFQNSNERLNVILTGIDLKVDTTNTNFVYMSSIKNATDLYNTNMYILDKMGINILENKDFDNCDCVVVGKKTASFYESLAHGNINYYVNFDFISDLLEKVYKRKKNIDLDLSNYKFKEIDDYLKDNIVRLAGKKLFESVGIDRINLVNAKNVTVIPDPKESVFKAHGIETVNVVNFNSDFDLNTDCITDSKGCKVLVVNNNIKNVNPLMNKIKKTIKNSEEHTEYLVVTWDFIMRSLLKMEIRFDSGDKGILMKAEASFN